MDALAFGAKQAVENCVKVKPGEKVVIITDHETKLIADAIKKAVLKITNNITLFVMEDFGERPSDGKNPLNLPKEIEAALMQTDVSFYLAQGKNGELQSFRAPLLGLVERMRIRHAHMPNFRIEMMAQGMSADYSKVQELCKKVYNIVSEATQIRVTTKAGTDVTAEFSPDFKWIICDGNITPDHWSNLPDGEVFTAPMNAAGKIVIDGCLGDFFAKKYGDIETTPVSYEVKDARAIKGSITCKNAELLEDFTNYICKTDENSNRIGEFALGTNTALKKLIGILLQDEKFPGVHIALGSPYPDKTGAKWNSKGHLDGVMKHCTVYVDGKKIMEDSSYLI